MTADMIAQDRPCATTPPARYHRHAVLIAHGMHEKVAAFRATYRRSLHFPASLSFIYATLRPREISTRVTRAALITRQLYGQFSAI